MSEAHEFVLGLLDEELATFASHDGPIFVVSMTREKWKAAGRPTTLTVAVLPDIDEED